MSPKSPLLLQSSKTRAIQGYVALKKVPKTQHIDKYLMQWETTYASAEKIKLAEIQDDKTFYDFVQAIITIDSAYANAYQVAMNHYDLSKACSLRRCRGIPR